MKQIRSKQLISAGVGHVAKGNYIRAAMAFSKAIKLAPDEQVREIYMEGLSIHLTKAAKVEEQCGHLVKAFIAKKLALHILRSEARFLSPRMKFSHEEPGNEFY